MIEILLTGFLQKLTDYGRLNDALIQVFCEFELTHSTTISGRRQEKLSSQNKSPVLLFAVANKPGKDRPGVEEAGAEFC
jgi:hypothetical protein